MCRTSDGDVTRYVALTHSRTAILHVDCPRLRADAGDPAFVPLLLALGLTELSLHPATLLEVRRAIRGCDLAALRAQAAALLRARDRAGIEQWLAANTPGA